MKSREAVPKPSNLPRFDLPEVTLVVLFACLVAWLAGRERGARVTYGKYVNQREASALRARYGPTRYSVHDEEWIIRDFFEDRRGGFFVDVGANHYKTASNTFYLEEHLRRSGIAIDPQREFAPDYAKYRPRTRFFPLFVSDESDATAKIYVLSQNRLVGSEDRNFTETFGKGAQAVEVPTITLDDLLRLANVTKIDPLSIDVELAEPKVLRGLAIERARPELVCIEAQAEVRQQILDYFAIHRYVAVGKYQRIDSDNVYFTPLR